MDLCSRIEFVVKMVSFICSACGQTVRKVQVEKHYQNDCPSCDVLSCIDCGKDFHGDEYVGHTSCITEAEKYQGKLYKPKDKQNKGEHKQQEWLKVKNSFRNFLKILDGKINTVFLGVKGGGGGGGARLSTYQNLNQVQSVGPG